MSVYPTYRIVLEIFLNQYFERFFFTFNIFSKPTYIPKISIHPAFRVVLGRFVNQYFGRKFIKKKINIIFRIPTFRIVLPKFLNQSLERKFIEIISNVWKCHKEKLFKNIK